MKKQALSYKYNLKANVRIVQDLSGAESKMVGLEARVEAQLPAQNGQPQYKVVIFGTNGVRGGVFEVAEQEIGPR